MFGKFYCHDIVTQELLRYTFSDGHILKVLWVK